MNYISKILTYGLSNLWTHILLVCFFRKHLEINITCKSTPYIIVIITTFITTCINLFSQSVIQNMIFTLIVIILVSSLFKPKFQSIFIGYYFFFTHLLVEDIVTIFFSLNGIVTYSTAMENGIIRIIIILIVELLFFINLVFITNKLKIIQENKRIFSYWSVLFLLCSISLFILHFTTINFIPDNEMSIVNLVNVLILLALNQFLLITLKSIIEYDVIKADYRELTMVSKYYNERITERLTVNEIKHDLKKILYSIYLMAKNKDFKGIMQTVSNYSDIMDNKKIISNTGIKEIDSIVNYFASKIDEEVDLQYTVLINEQLMINSKDCIVLIGNLLDNAYEAVNNVDNNHKKIIRIKVSLDRNVMHIEVENTYNGILCFDKDGELLSTKSEAFEHGFGLRSIKRIIRKYNGIYDFAPKTSNLFTSSIILYQMQENLT